MKPNFKALARKYKKLYIQMGNYFCDVREEFEKAQARAMEYMHECKMLMDENSRLQHKIADLTDKLHKQEAAYNELYEFATAGGTEQ